MLARAAMKGVSLPAQRGISLSTGKYVVSVRLGTPARDMTVVFDTGIDLLWVQCTPFSDWDSFGYASRLPLRVR
jgi:hypothetical protein